ncbi:MAG: ATP-dependent chaperone ClpB, partial [Bifidobacterium sp.]|nr:ATP-dependent chaperone ClpB [Bifidobacterium sp.]
AFGARPLRRLVQTEVGDQLARMLLAGKVHDGDTVLVDQTGGDHLELTAWPTENLVDDSVTVDDVTADGDADASSTDQTAGDHSDGGRDGGRGRHAARGDDQGQTQPH